MCVCVYNVCVCVMCVCSLGVCVDVFAKCLHVWCECVHVCDVCMCACGPYMSNEHMGLERVLGGSCSTHNERTSSAEMQAAISAVVIITGKTMWKANPIFDIQ